MNNSYLFNSKIRSFQYHSTSKDLINYFIIPILICYFFYNEFITNFIYDRNFRFCFKQKKHNINAYFNRNNAISYYILSIG